MLDWATGPLIFGWAFVLLWVPLVVLRQRKVHPRALFVLFFAELWERFSFYGMRALLTLYMTKVLFVQMAQGEADARAYGIYGAFNALLYGAPVIGGVLADQLLGFRRAIILGGLAMSAGQFTLAGTIGHELPFFVGLALIVVGNGLFKPNISSFLGTFYDRDDPRKDSAFTIFYMGINIGAFLSPLTCGYLGEKVDWSLGFLAAGIGIVLGVIVFWAYMRNFEDKGTPPDREKLLASWKLGLSRQSIVVLGALLSVPVLAFLLDNEEEVNWLLLVAGVGILGYILYTAMSLEDRVAGQRLLVFFALFFFHMVFWALFEQAGGSMTIFTERHVARHGIPTSGFQSVNPFCIILIAPLFSWIWVKLRQRNLEPRTPTKFVLGLVQMAAGFAVIVASARFASPEGVVPLLFLLLMYLLHTTGELSLSPVGLSVVTKLSPPQIVGFVMGAWFLSISFAHKIAGELGKLTAKPSADATPEQALHAFTDVYWTWGVLVVLGSAAVLLVISPILKKWMHGIH